MALKSRNDQNRGHSYRRFLSQFIAATVRSILSINAGMCYSMPTVVIAALTGVHNEHNRDEFLTITTAQASWLGALGFVFRFFGSLLTGVVTDPIGRKRSMILLSIPFIIGWCTLYRAAAVWEVVFGFAFFGFGMGLIESPLVIYLGETCEPSLRGWLIAYATICNSIGMFIINLLNNLMAWRKLCLVCATVPLIAMIALFVIPESPRWSLSNNRNAEAESALRWLRGWVSSEAVAKEFDDLKRHSERSKSCSTCIKQDLECTHPLPTLREKLVEFKRKRTLKPLFIIVLVFLLTHFASVSSMRPVMMQIFKAYKIPIPSDQAMTIMSILESAGTLTSMLLIRITGKRRLYLFSLTSALICIAIITWFGFTYLPLGYNSFDQVNSEFQLENKALGFIPMISLILWSYSAHCCMTGIPWMLLSELFPFTSRGMANGFAVSIHFIFAIISRKTYYNIETTLSLPGVSLLYTCICFMGLILMYNILPETENQTLEDIELHFSDNSKGLTDRKIAISRRQTNIELVESGNKNEIKSLI